MPIQKRLSYLLLTKCIDLYLISNELKIPWLIGSIKKVSIHSSPHAGRTQMRFPNLHGIDKRIIILWEKHRRFLRVFVCLYLFKENCQQKIVCYLTELIISHLVWYMYITKFFSSVRLRNQLNQVSIKSD